MLGNDFEKIEGVGAAIAKRHWVPIYSTFRKRIENSTKVAEQ